MLEADFYGKLLPTHPDIMDILRDIRKSAGLLGEGAYNAKVRWERG